jgi:predicted dithiol-disulfide oxidoreductase (DUF899 family)
MTERLHDVRFPGEPDEYRDARDELLRAEMDLRKQIEAVAAKRRELPPGGEPPEDYEFDEWDPARGASRKVRLSELFADGKDSLFLYAFMFRAGEGGDPLEVACPSCTSIIDALDGEVPHITEKINFAAVTKVPIERFGAHAQARGWRHVRLLSAAGNTYKRDYRSEDEDGFQLPVATVFVRRNGTIQHHWSSELFVAPREDDMHPRHVDFMWPLWNVLDCTPEGRGPDWEPSLEYR